MMGEEPKSCKSFGAEQIICSFVSVNGIEKSSMQLQLELFKEEDGDDSVPQIMVCCQL
jgi:hypothetical protein